MSELALMTAAEFEVYALRSENRDRRIELIDGVVYESFATWYTSWVGANFVGLLGNFLHQTRLGRLTGADGGYMVSGQCLVPNVGCMTVAHQPHCFDGVFNPLAPDLAVEVISPLNQQAHLDKKIALYRAAGTLLWVADPESEQITVHLSEQAPLILSGDDMVYGNPALPGFAMPVGVFFQDTIGRR